MTASRLDLWRTGAAIVYCIFIPIVTGPEVDYVPIWLWGPAMTGCGITAFLPLWVGV